MRRLGHLVRDRRGARRGHRRVRGGESLLDRPVHLVLEALEHGRIVDQRCPLHGRGDDRGRSGILGEPAAQRGEGREEAGKIGRRRVRGVHTYRGLKVVRRLGERFVEYRGEPRVEPHREIVLDRFGGCEGADGLGSRRHRLVQGLTRARNVRRRGHVGMGAATLVRVAHHPRGPRVHEPLEPRERVLRTVLVRAVGHVRHVRSLRLIRVERRIAPPSKKTEPMRGKRGIRATPQALPHLPGRRDAKHAEPRGERDAHGFHERQSSSGRYRLVSLNEA